MFEKGTYTIEEFARVIGKELSVVLKTRKRCEETYLSDYIWSKEGKGKNIVYIIEGQNYEASPLIDTFYSLLEGFSGQDVYFKNPDTAIKVLYHLYQRNENIALFIARDLGIAERTVRDYIKRFRKLGLLVGYWDHFIVDGKEVEKQVLSDAQYDYYQVVDGKWHEVNLDCWKDAFDFKRNAYECYVEEFESATDWNVTKEEDKLARKLALKLMVEEFGEPKRVSHKYLIEDAKACLGSFLVYAAEKLGLSFEKREMKTREYIRGLYQKRSASIRIKSTDHEPIFEPIEVVDVGRKYVGTFEEWYLVQQQALLNDEFKIGFDASIPSEFHCVSKLENCKRQNETAEERKPMNFKELINTHEFMRVQDAPEIEENTETVEEKALLIDEDPFTKKPIVFNEKTQRWEDYIESEWVNGEKIEKESYYVPRFPMVKRNKVCSALDEMDCSF